MKFPILYLNNFLKLNKKYTQRKNFPFLSWNGKKGDNITIQQVGTGNDLIFNAGCSGGFSITNPWGVTDVTDSTTTTTTTDTTAKGGGDDVGDCEPEGCQKLRDEAYKAHTRYVAWNEAYRITKEKQCYYKPRFYDDPSWPGGLGYEMEFKWLETVDLMHKIAEEEGLDFEENFSYLRSKAIEQQLEEINKEIIKAGYEYTALCHELIANGCSAPSFCFEPSIL